MKRIFAPFAILATVGLLMASCLGDDDTEYTYYDDTAITSFTLGTLNRYRYLLNSAGEDSIARSTVTGSNYKFYIDQDKREVYNPDSLPYGTDVEKVVCTIATKNSGVVLLKHPDNDSVMYYVSTDSIDFSRERTVYVYANSGKTMREYTIRVNVHREEADSMPWRRAAIVPELAQMQGMKALTVGQRLFVAGNLGGQTVLLKGDAANESEWQLASFNFNAMLPADAWQGFVAQGDHLYMLLGETLMRSADGDVWEEVARDTGLSRLVAATDRALYALTTAGLMAGSRDGGATWQMESLDSEAALLPTEQLSGCVVPLRTNADAATVVVTGLRQQDLYPEDTLAVSWSRIEEWGNNAHDHSWMYHAVDATNRYTLPRRQSLQTVGYDGNILALGLAGEQNDSTCLYVSRDQGITWKADGTYPLPAALSVGQWLAVTADSDNYLWLFCATSGEVWRGRMNRLGWATEPTSFGK